VRGVHGKARRTPVFYRRGSKPIPTRGVERPNGTSRRRNQRQGRQTLALATAPRSHRWMRGLSVGLSNFCRPPRSWTIKDETQVTPRRPARAAGRTDHLWTVRAWLLCPVIGGQG
jgi:hypothetical protein